MKCLELARFFFFFFWFSKTRLFLLEFFLRIILGCIFVFWISSKFWILNALRQLMGGVLSWSWAGWELFHSEDYVTLRKKYTDCTFFYLFAPFLSISSKPTHRAVGRGSWSPPKKNFWAPPPFYFLEITVLSFLTKNFLLNRIIKAAFTLSAFLPL